MHLFIQIDQENIIIPLIRKMDKEKGQWIHPSPPQEAKYDKLTFFCNVRIYLKQDSIFAYQINIDFNADKGTAKQPLVHF